MKRYKIVVAYDGTDFHGWQEQPSDTTIVSTLKRGFKTAFHEDASVIGASRTDAGVHAIGQVALVRTPLDIDATRLCKAWNNSLPSSVVVRSIVPAHPGFHVFADVQRKTYWYHLFVKRPLPMVARYGWFWKFIDSVDFALFENALRCFVGEHDFRSFCKNECGETTVRTIDSIKVTKIARFHAVRVEIKARGFLRYQIRRMLGAALDVARKNELHVLQDSLRYPSDQQEFVRADAAGLCLRKIMYKER